MTSPLTPNRREVLIGATLAPLAAPPALAAARNARPSVTRGGAQADALGRALLAQAKAPALTIAVAGPDGLRWSAAYGMTNLELEVAASTRHSFRLGSVSKLLTATAAARLVSRGLIDLDAPIVRWLPDLPAHHRQTSLRQLLTHRGGVRHYNQRDYDITGPGGAIYMRQYRTSQDVLDLFIADPLVAPAGTRVSYSSFGFTLASIVMEKAAGKLFPELIKTEIGETFGLASLIEDDPFKLVASRSTGYLAQVDSAMIYGQLPPEARPKLTNGLANIPVSNPAYCWAGAGFLMTTEDCARFGAALLERPGSRLSAAERALLFTPMTEKTKDSPPLGLAWRIDADAKGRTRWHHAGATLGGRYSLAVYPDQGLSVSLASNVMTAPGDVLTPSSALVDIFA